MPDRSRIPRKIADLNAYINNTCRWMLKESAPVPAHLLPPDNRENWEKLGILPSQMRVFDTLFAQWQILYKLYSNPGTSSPAIEEEIIGIRIRYTQLVAQFPGLVAVIGHLKESAHPNPPEGRELQE